MSATKQKTVPQPVHNGADTDLPEGWASTILDELGHWTTGGTPSRKVSKYFGGSIPWVKSGDLKDGHVTATEEKITTSGIENSAAKRLPPGTVSIALYGATIGKLGILDIGAATNQACANCEVNEKLTDRRFLFFVLLGQRQALIEAGQGGAQPNINNRIVRDWPIAIAPIAEQKRIVAKVEELLAQVNSARDRLAKVPKLLKRFRQSVLAAACSGRLTEEWRMQHAGVESATALLSRIRQSHNDGGFGQGGKAATPTDDVHTLAADEVPDSWVIAELMWLCAPGRSITYGILKPGPNLPDGVPYIRVADFPNDRLNVSGIRTTSAKIANEYRRSALRSGDVLLSIRGTAGRICRVPDVLDGANITQDTARIAVHPEMSADYIEIYLRCHSVQKRLGNAMKGVAVRGVNIGDVRVLQIAFPSLPEQHEIIRRVASLFKLADAIEKRVKAATKRADKLTQAILGKAFRGELVPTEAELARREGRTYEPASVLLERIRAEQAAGETNSPTKGKGGRVGPQDHLKSASKARSSTQ